MSNSATDRATTPRTVWLARGRHNGAPTAEDVLRRNLRRLKVDEVLDDFAEPPDPEDTPGRVFEARWRVAGGVTVRARLTLLPPQGREDGRKWRLVAEAERPWDDAWPSPATMFWPDDEETAWDHHDAVPELRLRHVNPLPADDKVMRRVLRDAARESWCVNVVVHEAMTPDALGKLPLARLLPPGLRHRVVEHRAAPHQLRAVNYALKDLGVEVPRGGAVVLPPHPAPPDHDARDHAVRSVFLDGSEPAELIDVLRRFTTLPRPLPEGAEQALTGLREKWTLLTLEEELARQRELVAMYAEALEAMTRSRDLYREAAERANEALAAYRDAPAPPAERPAAPSPSPLQQLTRTFERLKVSAKALRPAPASTAARDAGDTGEAEAGGTDRPS
ncbi:hypothetical protein [Streptomyces sp. NPDC051636]|uniref:hypothetical protein n=1 Tax=Streptomyces sp. NPDC051636 TaxID=3365663 RepID=UPI0037A1DDAF